MGADDFDHRASAGVSDPALAALLLDHWEAAMRRWPTWAGRIGDRRFDDRLPGTRPEDLATAREERDAFLSRSGEIPSDTLSPGDRLTRDLLSLELETARAVDEFRMEEWTLLPRSNPLTLVGGLPEVRPVETDEDAAALLARYGALGAYVDGEIETLRRGVEAGKFSNAESVRRIIEMVRAELEKPEAEWAAVSLVPEEHRSPAAKAVASSVRPALSRYVEFLEGEVHPRAREGDRVGLAGLPDGEECYAALIRRHTSLDLTAEEVHATGLAELEKIHGEFSILGDRVLGTAEPAEIFARLRTDPDLHFETEEQVEAKAQSALDAAREAMPSWFGRLPAADCVVKRVPDHEAPYTTIAYYRPPAEDGSRPGEYRINVFAPETRPRHEAEVLAFHEAIPGHHLQIAIAQELPELPAFRRHAGVTAYVEGWALYIERLAEEMGLYTGDLDRLGMLSFDAWRAARLVVDTGVHARGWSRERAVAFMLENTPLAENNVDNEVDRYISWPGQALAYKIGQLEMWRLRRDAEAARGGAFDVKAFHDLVLGGGALPLRALREQVSAWMGVGT